MSAMLKAPRFGSSRLTLAMVFADALAFASNAGLARTRYVDLRRIEPVNSDAAAGAKKATVCLACHGANGVSVAPNFPRLTVQRPDYLYHRLLSFKRANPKDPYDISVTDDPERRHP
jgi:cytochrome c553